MPPKATFDQCARARDGADYTLGFINPIAGSYTQHHKDLYANGHAPHQIATQMSRDCGIPIQAFGLATRVDVRGFKVLCGWRGCQERVLCNKTDIADHLRDRHLEMYMKNPKNGHRSYRCGSDFCQSAIHHKTGALAIDPRTFAPAPCRAPMNRDDDAGKVAKHMLKDHYYGDRFQCQICMDFGAVFKTDRELADHWVRGCARAHAARR